MADNDVNRWLHLPHDRRLDYLVGTPEVYWVSVGTLYSPNPSLGPGTYRILRACYRACNRGTHVVRAVQYSVHAEAALSNFLNDGHYGDVFR